jgi:hypothetical protein
MPNDRDHDNEYIKPSRIHFWPPGRSKEFIKDFLYLTLWSPSQITVDIMIKFNSIENALGKKKIEQTKISGQEGHIANKSLITEEQEKLLNKMTLLANKSKVIIGNDIVMKNIKIAFKWREISQQKIENIKEDFTRKLDEVKTNNK